MCETHHSSAKGSQAARGRNPVRKALHGKGLRCIVRSPWHGTCSISLRRVPAVGRWRRHPLNTEHAHVWEAKERRRSRYRVAGAQVIKWSVRTVDWAEQIQETLFIYEEILPDGTTHRTACPFTIRFLWRGEAELLLQSAGFTVEEVWGDFDGTPYHATSDHLILLANKPGVES